MTPIPQVASTLNNTEYIKIVMLSSQIQIHHNIASILNDTNMYKYVKMVMHSCCTLSNHSTTAHSYALQTAGELVSSQWDQQYVEGLVSQVLGGLTSSQGPPEAIKLGDTNIPLPPPSVRTYPQSTALGPG